MTTAVRDSHPGYFMRRRSMVSHAGLIAFLAFVVLMPGCGGCRRSAPETQTDAEKALAERQKKMAKPKPKPDFEFGFLRQGKERQSSDGEPMSERGLMLAAQPHDGRPLECCVKPGHWTMGTMPAKANNFSVVGRLDTTAVDRNTNPLRLEGLPFTMAAERAAALQKGKPKRFDVAMFLPEGERASQPMLRCNLRASKGSLASWQDYCLVLPMPAYQYHFVVLADSPALYGYIRDIDATKPPNDPGYDFGDARRGYYRVCLLESGRSVALPAHGLFWTSIAYLLWDNADPDRLTLDQQLALLDWLHWGGQLILSGPDTLDRLAGSFLAPYLPVESPVTRELKAGDLDGLNQNWTMPEPPVRTTARPRPFEIDSTVRRGPPSKDAKKSETERLSRPLQPLQPWTGVAWQIHPEAREVPGTGGLLAERRVGRGRVVVSAFRLSQREFTSWPSRHGFFNGCLMARPSRRFFMPNDRVVAYATWADRSLQLRALDPLLCSTLRYFSRDYGRQPTTVSTETFEQPESVLVEQPSSGVAGWNDFSPVADAARDALTTAAKIEIPERTFVLWAVGVYLVVLVPLNWLVFRVLGRVEWAWVAAPAIALVSTGMVIHMARLDIGFARSMTEIDVVELQAGYPRAHVSRYMAMYTSLATTYAFHSEDPGVQVLPLPDADGGRDAARFGVSELSYRYGSDVELDGLQIMSNTADMAHSEQMLDLGGAVSIVRDEADQLFVVNGTQYAIRGAGVVERDPKDGLRSAWLGEIEPGGRAAVQFRPAVAPAKGSLWQEQRNRESQTAGGSVEGRLSLSRLCYLAEDTSTLSDGDVRLVGWMEDELPGLEVRPAAPQARRAAVVVANLEFGLGEAPRRDENMWAEFKDQ